MNTAIQDQLKKIDYAEISRRIRRSRRDVDMTQVELAKAIGVDVSVIKSIEINRARPDIAKLIGIAMATGQSLHYLMCLTDTRLPEPEPEKLNFEQRDSNPSVASQDEDGIQSTQRRGGGTVDATDLKSVSPQGSEGSSPSPGTTPLRWG